MAERKRRFGGFLEPGQITLPESTPQPQDGVIEAEATSAVIPSREPEDVPYLLRRFPRDEALARLGNGVRAASKYHLEDYVRALKRAGWPASEARAIEAMFELLGADQAFREKVTTYLTGKDNL